MVGTVRYDIRNMGAEAKDETAVGSSETARYIAERISSDDEVTIHDSFA